MFLSINFDIMRIKLVVHLISIILVILVVIGISTSNIIDEFKPILIGNDERISSTVNINMDDNKLAFSGWEGFLYIDNETKIVRILGAKERDISHFYNEEDSKKIEENKVYWHNETKDPKEIGYVIKNPEFKPYLKLQMFVKTEKELEKSGYGFILRNFNIYLPNGTILKNDYLNIEGNLTGTNYKEKVQYEIFFNEKEYNEFLKYKEVEGKKAVLDPWKAIAFSPIAEKEIYSRVPPGPNQEYIKRNKEIEIFFNQSCTNETFLKDNEIDLIIGCPNLS